MADDLILKTDKKPTMFNPESKIGLWAGFLLAATTAIGFTPIGFLTMAAAMVAGGFLGKIRMAREESQGKRISEHYNPLNLHTVDATLSGATAGAAISVLLAGFGFEIPLIAGIATMIGGGALGAFLGAKIGEKYHAAEYEQAKTQTIVRNISRTVSPEAGQAMEYAMEHQKEWAQDVTKDRMLADAQQRVH